MTKLLVTSFILTLFNAVPCLQSCHVKAFLQELESLASVEQDGRGARWSMSLVKVFQPNITRRGFDGFEARAEIRIHDATRKEFQACERIQLWANRR